MMQHTVDVIGGNGVPFRIVYTPSAQDDHGNTVGAVEFFDRRWDHTANGQFVSSYWLGAILDGSNSGIDLQGGVDDWTIDAINMGTVRFWLRNLRDSARAGVGR